MARVMRAAAAVLGASAAIWLATADSPEALEQPIALALRPQVMLARGDIRAELRIPRDSDNRAVSLAWTSDYGNAGSTVRQLEGEDSPALIVVALPDQPPAHYVFVASLYGQRGELRGRATAEILTPDGGNR